MFNIFSIISAPKLKQSVIFHIIKIIESIVNLDNIIINKNTEFMEIDDNIISKKDLILKNDIDSLLLHFNKL